MINRALFYGLFLIALAPGVAAVADPVPAPATNSSPVENPIAADGTSKVPNNVPDIIGSPSDHDKAMSKATTDPRAALDPSMFAPGILLPNAAGGDFQVDWRPRPRVSVLSPLQE